MVFGFGCIVACVGRMDVFKVCGGTAGGCELLADTTWGMFGWFKHLPVIYGRVGSEVL